MQRQPKTVSPRIAAPPSATVVRMQTSRSRGIFARPTASTTYGNIVGPARILDQHITTNITTLLGIYISLTKS